MKGLKILSVLVLALLSGFVLVGCDVSAYELGENEVKVKNSESTFEGSNYEDVVEKLQKWGFTNIETKAVYDIIWGITEEGSTKSVSIDGSSTYEYGDIFDKDVLIVVTYSMRVGDEPEEPEEPLAENEVRVLSSEYSLTGENYETVVDTLEGWGFTNITTLPVYDIVFDITKPGSTKDVKINGLDNYKNGDIFNKDTEIIVTYSMRDDDAPKFIVSYDLDGGSWSRSNEESIDPDGLITTSIPLKDGHDFVGWLLDGETFNDSTPITSDLSLKAQWYLPNYEDILVGRWEGRLASTKALGFAFLEFDGSFYDLDGERTSGAIDFDHNWGSFTLYGNKIGFNYIDADTQYFTLSYADDKITMKNNSYPDIVMYKTEDTPNSLSWKWYDLYEFAKTQSEIKTDTYGSYYEISMDMTLRNISPNIKLVETNRQVIKVYNNKLIDIYFYYVGVEDTTVEMIVNIAFDYNQISDNNITNAYIYIESENYLMVTNKGITSIEFDQEADLFWFTTSNVEDNANNFAVSSDEVMFTLEYFSEMALFNIAEDLINNHDIYLFTE